MVVEWGRRRRRLLGGPGLLEDQPVLVVALLVPLETVLQLRREVAEVALQLQRAVHLQVNRSMMDR